MGALHKVEVKNRGQLGLFGAACLAFRVALLRTAANVADEPTTETS